MNEKEVNEEDRCPTCQGRFWSVKHSKWIHTRETIDMVCQTCGRDYSVADEGVLPHCRTCKKPMSYRNTRGIPRVYCSRLCWERRGPSKSFDLASVDRLVEGDPPDVTTKTERMMATARLTKLGYSARWISEYLHIAERSVTRYRKEFKENNG